MKVIPFDLTIRSNFVITRARLNRTPFVGTSSENESQSYHENFVSEILQDPQNNTQLIPHKYTPLIQDATNTNTREERRNGQLVITRARKTDDRLWAQPI